MSALAVMCTGSWTSDAGVQFPNAQSAVVSGTSRLAVFAAQALLDHPDIDLKAAVTMANMRINNPAAYATTEANHGHKTPNNTCVVTSQSQGEIPVR